MAVELLLFGQLKESLAGIPLSLEGITDTDQLKAMLEDRCPFLRELNFQIAVDQQLIHANTQFGANATLALLPPYAGG